MIYFITYGNEKYENQKKRLGDAAKKSLWFDDVSVYGPNDLDETFTKENSELLKHATGGGYWIWKPYIIMKKLNEINDNDILIYIDAGCSLNVEGKKRFEEYIKIVEQSPTGILSFQLFKEWKSTIPLLEKNWTNKFLFDYLNITDRNIENTPQLVGGIMIMKKCKNVINIFSHALKILKEQPLFYQQCKRHDQSILSVLRKMHGSEVIPDETYFKHKIEAHPLGWDDPISLQYPFHARRHRT